MIQIKVLESINQVVKSMTLTILVVLGNSELVFSQEIFWIRPEGGERNEYVFFKKDVELNGEVQEAQLHLYVDSRYALYVNGYYLGFGPVRSYHAIPYYDSFDLKPFLQIGKNVITVLAMNNGMETFQLFDNKGGVAFWGEIITERESFGLNTKEWKAKKSLGFDQSTPRFSFAKGPIESWDLRVDTGWNTVGMNFSDWIEPVLVRNQDDWGDFKPRPIPKLTKSDIKAIRLMGAFQLKNDEDFYTFRVLTPDLDIGEYSIGHPGLANTYIYSPKAQKINAGMWWGEYFINGVKVNPMPSDRPSYYRQEFEVDLKQGWNELLVRNRVIWGTWDFYISLPKEKGLQISPNQKEGDAEWFNVLVPLKEDIEEQIMSSDLTKGINWIVDQFKQGWEIHNRNGLTNPAKDVAWLEPDFDQLLSKGGVFIEPIIMDKNPTGASLFFDMGEIQLGQFFVEGDFPDGTIIDIGFSEELNHQGLPWLYKRHQVGAGIRFVSDGKQNRFQSFKPYGARYLKVNIRTDNRPFTLNDIGMIRQVFPFERLGSFSCSDPLMDRIWEASWRTLEICAEDSYTDTPFRERGLYAGDMIPQMAMTQAVSGDMRLVEHSINLFQEMYRDEMWEGAPNRHLDYVFFTLIALDEYAKLTGDWDFVHQYYKNYQSLVNQFASRYVGGLIHTERVFIEWTTINKGDARMTALQALYFYSLQRLAEWAERFGYTEDRKSYMAEAEKLRY